MKIAVVGAGAMGMLFGARLSLSGSKITMIDVVPSLLEILNKDGISLKDPGGSYWAPVDAMRGDELKEAQDLVILFTKTLYSRGALEAAAGYIGPNTYVLTLQNGLGNMELISEYVARDKIMIGVTNYASDVKAPGVIETQDGGYVRFMFGDGVKRPIVEDVLDLLVKAGFDAYIYENVWEAVWEKVGFNAALNSTTALCRLTVGEIGACDEGRTIAHNIARETAMVACAHGVNVKAESIIHSVDFALDAHKGHYPSMAQDVMNKRATEVDFINGQIVKKAGEKGLKVPYCESVYLLMKVLEKSYISK